ncbi:MAG: hypothetical protein GX868_05195 [Actinobacteria bacterium]|nr:hypothetical protein [Actinomycetota bacterium]
MKKFWQRPTEIASHDIVTTTIRTWKTEDYQGMSWSEPLEWLTRDLQHEARLTDAARPRVRTMLMDLLLARAVGGKTGIAERDLDAPVILPRTVVFAGADAPAIARLAAAYGASALNDPLRSEFCGLEWELDFHLPHFAEWQADDPLADQYASAARRSSYGSTNATIGTTAAHLWCAFGHAEHLTQIRRAMPAAVIVSLSGGSDRSTIDSAIERRRSWSDAVDEDKVERYWRWRLERLRTKTEAQLLGFRTAGDTLLVEIDTAEALRDPARLGVEISTRLGT